MRSRQGPGSRVVGLSLLLLVLAGCATTPPPTPSPAVSVLLTASPGISLVAFPGGECGDVPQAEPGACAKVIAAIREARSQDAATASRLLIVDKCPRQVLCERSFLYDFVVVLLPANGDTGSAVAIHVFGHVAEPLRVEAWTSPLPDHVATLLSQGN